MDRIPALRRAILADSPAAKALGWSGVAVAIPTALRWIIDHGSAISPFVTYYPAIALASLFLGWHWGAAVAVASIVVADRLFSQETFWSLLTGPSGLTIGLFALSCSVLVLTGEMVRRLLRQLEEAKSREELLNQELMHRVKNMLATVNAMAVLTARHTEPGQFTAAFSGRMKALDRATDLLAVGHDAQCEARELVHRALEPFRANDNFHVEGPHCRLPRDSCVPLSLAIHELCTNAVKHGALGCPAGRVELAWTQEPGGRVRFRWREQGGPPVSAPRHAGMGMQLLRTQRGLSSVAVRFPPQGCECDIDIDDAEPMPQGAGSEKPGQQGSAERVGA